LFIANETWTFSSNGGFNSKIGLSLFKIFFYFFLIFLIHFRDHYLVPEKQLKESVSNLPQTKEILSTPKINKVPSIKSEAGSKTKTDLEEYNIKKLVKNLEEKPKNSEVKTLYSRNKKLHSRSPSITRENSIISTQKLKFSSRLAAKRKVSAEKKTNLIVN
jgi:hypothetical protein